jgi:hypothetical protein
MRDIRQLPLNRAQSPLALKYADSTAELPAADRQPRRVIIKAARLARSHETDGNLLCYTPTSSAAQNRTICTRSSTGTRHTRAAGIWR